MTKPIEALRIQMIPDTSTASLRSVIRQNIALVSIIETDGWKSYAYLPTEGYQHLIISTSENAD